MRTPGKIVHDYLVLRGDAGKESRQAMVNELESLVEEAYGQGLRDGAAGLKG